MSNVAFLPPLEERVPVRSPWMLGRMRLIGLFAEDDALVDLVRHLYQRHSILTVAQLDAAGWAVVNTYPGKLSQENLREFFHTIGRKAKDRPTGGSHAQIVRFPKFEP
jgi:hypothetical protein